AARGRFSWITPLNEGGVSRTPGASPGILAANGDDGTSRHTRLVLLGRSRGRDGLPRVRAGGGDPLLAGVALSGRLHRGYRAHHGRPRAAGPGPPRAPDARRPDGREAAGPEAHHAGGIRRAHPLPRRARARPPLRLVVRPRGRGPDRGRP